MQHPNVVQLHEFAVDRSTGCAFLVMEPIAGSSLADILRAEGPLSVARALSVLCQVSAALVATHERGLAHRDVKPGNIMCEPTGRVVVVDFGLAKWIGAESDLTRSGAVLGTLPYLAPEMLRGEVQDARACDVFAIGVVGYQMLSGKLPFDASTEAALFRAHQKTIPSVRHLRADVPERVSALIDSALARDPSVRPSVVNFERGLPTQASVSPYLAARSDGVRDCLTLDVSVKNDGDSGEWQTWVRCVAGERLRWLARVAASRSVANVVLRVVLPPHLVVAHEATRLVSSASDAPQSPETSKGLFSGGIAVGNFDADAVLYCVFETTALGDFDGTSAPVALYGHVRAEGIAERLVGRTPPYTDATSAVVTIARDVKTVAVDVGRNDPCWCGSGKRFKRCHGA